MNDMEFLLEVIEFYIDNEMHTKNSILVRDDEEFIYQIRDYIRGKYEQS